MFSSLEAGDPDNEEILKLFTSKYDRTLFKRLCVSNCIKWSWNIYQEHAEGVGTIRAALSSQLTQKYHSQVKG